MTGSSNGKFLTSKSKFFNDKIRIFAGASIGHFANDGTLLIFTILMVYYIRIPNVNIAVLGSIAVTYQLLSGYISTRVGKYADAKRDFNKLISVGILIEGLGIFLFSISFLFHNLFYLYALALLAALVLGFGQAFYHPLGGALLSATFGKSSPKYMGANGVFGSLGRSVLPSLIAFSILLFGDAAGLIPISAFYLLLSIIIFVLLVNRTNNKVFRGKNKEDLLNLSSDTADMTTSKKFKTHHKPFSFYRRSVYKLTFVTVLRSASIMATITFIGVYIKLIEKLTATEVGIFLTITFFFAVIGQYVFGVLVTKVGNRKTVIYSTLISVIAFGLFLLLRGPIYSYIFYSVFTFAALTSFPIFMSYSANIVEKEYNGYSNSVVWGIGSIIGGAMGVGLITILLYFGFNIFSGMVVAEVIGIISILSLPILPKTLEID